MKTLSVYSFSFMKIVVHMIMEPSKTSGDKNGPLKNSFLIQSYNLGYGTEHHL
jgi:hypothetical protein